MAKKKGGLKHAIASYNKQKEIKAKQAAIEAARQSKVDSYTATKAKRQKASAPAETAKPKRLEEPFARDDSILIVGEANFSFALSLLIEPRCHPPSQLLATAYDSEQECYRKYPDAQANVARIREIACRDDIVIFGVDAGQLDKVKQITGRTKGAKSTDPDFAYQQIKAQRRWSKVWFGFPHVGAGHKDETRNVLANQLLLIRFFISVAPYLTVGTLSKHAALALGKPVKQPKADEGDLPDQDDEEGQEEEDEAIFFSSEVNKAQMLRPPSRQGSVLITLRNASPYTLWAVPSLAKRLPEMMPPIVAAAPPLPKGCKKPTLQDVHANGICLSSTTAAGQRKKGRQYHLWRSFEFDPTQWKGYEHRRTIGWVEGVSEGDNADLLRNRSKQSTDPSARASRAGGGECRTWEFGLD